MGVRTGAYIGQGLATVQSKKAQWFACSKVTPNEKEWKDLPM
jgi:hypothetical protein